MCDSGSHVHGLMKSENLDRTEMAVKVGWKTKPDFGWKSNLIGPV